MSIMFSAMKDVRGHEFEFYTTHIFYELGWSGNGFLISKECSSFQK